MTALPRGPDRERRQLSNKACGTGRTVAERDRDRVLYTTAFRRLAGVTQVVAPNEGHVVHNRLTHVLEVAQIARRLAERLKRTTSTRTIAAIGGLEENVVEAAALAHDLGHPPFGHVAEAELDKLVRAAGIHDGFEGNAQSFRIVTKLATRKANEQGLDLCRATLGAILKYPWLRSRDIGTPNYDKFGAYSTEEKDLNFARRYCSDPTRQTAEARIMDLADDIAYSLSDIEDSVRSHRIPFERLKYNKREQDTFIDSALPKIRKVGPVKAQELGKTLRKLLKMIPLNGNYTGRRQERAALRQFSAALMGDYIKHAKIDPKPALGSPFVVIPREDLLEISVLKQLTFHYVIDHPALALQQETEKKIIRGLFEVFSSAVIDEKTPPQFIPDQLKEHLECEAGGQGKAEKAKKIRCVADFIAGMSDNEAVEMYQRLNGMSVSRSIGAFRI